MKDLTYEEKLVLRDIDFSIGEEGSNISLDEIKSLLVLKQRRCSWFLELPNHLFLLSKHDSLEEAKEEFARVRYGGSTDKLLRVMVGIGGYNVKH